MVVVQPIHEAASIGRKSYAAQGKMVDLSLGPTGSVLLSSWSDRAFEPSPPGCRLRPVALGSPALGTQKPLGNLEIAIEARVSAAHSRPKSKPPHAHRIRRIPHTLARFPSVRVRHAGARP